MWILRFESWTYCVFKIQYGNNQWITRLASVVSLGNHRNCDLISEDHKVIATPGTVVSPNSMTRLYIWTACQGFFRTWPWHERKGFVRDAQPRVLHSTDFLIKFGFQVSLDWLGKSTANQRFSHEFHHSFLIVFPPSQWKSYGCGSKWKT